jgi:acyl carrier protein
VTRQAIEEWLVRWIAKELGLPPEVIETSESLLNYSLSSVTAMMLVGDLEEWLGLTLPPTLVWDYPSIAAIVDALAEQVGSPSADVPADPQPLHGAGAELVTALESLSDQEVDALLSRMMAGERAGAEP